MQQTQPTGGWIKLYRSIKDNGHLQMPEKAFKVWVYCLLQVNHKLGAGCQPGEGWITYQMIRENCCDPERPPWNDTTIRNQLDYLEDRGYIERIKRKNGSAMRVRVINWDTYQSQSTTDTVEVPVVVTVEPAVVVAVEKQEGERTQRSQEETEEEGRTPSDPPKYGSNWLRLKEWLQVNCHRSFTDSKIEHRWMPFLFDMGQEVIELACAEAALQGHDDKPAYTFSILNNWLSKKVKNADDARRLIAEFEAEKQRKSLATGRSERQRSPTQPRATATAPTYDPEAILGHK